MRNSGHIYSFQDYDTKEDEYIQRLGVLLSSGVSEPQQQGTREGEELFAKIEKEIPNCGCAELPGQVHPDIIPRLYPGQTRKWRGMAEDHLKNVAEGVKLAAEEILESVARGAVAPVSSSRSGWASCLSRTTTP